MSTDPLSAPSVLLRGVRFAVDDVAPAADRIRNEPLSRSLARRFKREVLLVPEPDRPVINPDAGSQAHPLIDAVGTAFSRHYPLRLSPDAVWLVIAQGFSHHICEHSEALRGRLVRHQGRRELTARVEGLTLAEVAGAIDDFSAQIREASDPVLHETLLCDFSTTTPEVRTASEVVLMDTYSSYFQYEMRCVCGIPSITLIGTREDWERIRARVEVLGTYDLEWWVSRLRPILDLIIETVSGRPGRQFWRAIYKPKHVYATTMVTRWIADLFPYLGDAPDRVPNHVFRHERRDWAIPVAQGVSTSTRGVATDSFPSGLSSVPVKVSFPDGTTRDLDFVAGFVGVRQTADLSLSPVISWSLAEKAPVEPVWI
jgi:hypothetical protein